MNNENDKYLWLEEIESERSLNWVKAKNKDTLKEFENDSDYKTKFEIALEIYQAQDKLPYVQFMDGLLYNFWRDEVHIKGILRRTTVSSYLSDNPAWELVLDLDELSQTESKSWVLQKYSKERTASRMLMFLSDGGTDAHYVREFDLDKKVFVTSYGLYPIEDVIFNYDFINIKILFRDGLTYSTKIKIIDKNTIVFEKMDWFDSIGILDFYGYEHPYYRIGGPNTPIIKMVSVDNLRLRETPDVSSKVILLMKKNTKVEIIDLGEKTFVNKVSGTWLKVRTTQGEEGWCFDAYLEEVKEELKK